MPAIDRRTFIGLLGGALALRIGAAEAASSGAATIMLIRHGEDLGEESVHLNARGVQRAEALPRLFVSRLPRPQIIMATRASKNSNRPVETVEPLARELQLPIDTRFRDDDFALLARRLLTDERYAGQVVLVCWHHQKLPKLARALGATDAPPWPDAQFDHVWVITYTPKGGARFDDVHQQLLDGDR
jgi:hypothetical protein